LNEKEQKISAFMQLYKPLQKQLSAYCRVLTGDEDAACDLLQDTLLTAFESFEEIRHTDSFIYYLCSIARHKYLKQKRRWKFFGKPHDITYKNIEITPDAIELQPDVELLYKAIGKLNDEQREVLLMFHIMGFSLQDIQKQIGLTEAAVKNRLARARVKLKQMLSDSETSLAASIPTNFSKTGQI